MEPMRMPFVGGTAIPERFGPERERVLRILARWEASTRAAAICLRAHPVHETPMTQSAGSR
jgi:hypothetical protein